MVFVGVDGRREMRMGKARWVNMGWSSRGGPGRRKRWGEREESGRRIGGK